jgi:tetratricopeptide (TPR) repeat protein
MTSIAKLKDRARKHEQREDWDAAIRAYQQVLETEEREGEIELELGLFNRIGDLYLRLGQTEDAVAYYVTAADKYAESGFFNNAIALCNKALRHRPERSDLYLKLSALCAEQGFITDARRWILEYAERQMRNGKVERALESLEEFADMSDDPDIRELLAHQLVAHDREDDAVGQLRRAYQLRMDRGERAAADAVAERARALDPDVSLEVTAGDEPEEFGFEGRTREPAGLPGLEAFQEEPTKDPGAGPVAYEEPDQEEAGAGDVSGLEVSQSEQGVGGGDGPDAGTLGGLETFDEDAEPEPLPLLDEDGDDEDEPEPLPLLDTGYQEEPEAGEVTAAATPEVDDDPVAEDADEVEPFDLGGDGMPMLDLGAVGGNTVDDDAMDEVHGHEPPDDAMDLDLAAFDLGMGEEGPIRAEDLDVDAVLNRAKQQVSRGLTSEALRELRLLSRGTVPVEAYRQAFSVATEIVRHNANDEEALQRRVEYAARIGEQQLLVDAYIDLADALGRLGSEVKARAM